MWGYTGDIMGVPFGTQLHGQEFLQIDGGFSGKIVKLRWDDGMIGWLMAGLLDPFGLMTRLDDGGDDGCLN